MSSNGVLIRAATVLWAVTLTAILPERAWAQNQAESLSASFRKAAQRVGPALVGIRVASVGRPLVNVPIPQVGPFRPGDLIPRGVLPGSELEVDTLGSGFLIDSDRGLVVTTEQVLRGSSQAIVVFSDGTERPASQIRRDPRLRGGTSQRGCEGAPVRAPAIGATRAHLSPATGFSPWAQEAAGPLPSPLEFSVPDVRALARRLVTIGSKPTFA